MDTQPKVRVGANTPSKPRRVNSSDPALDTFFMLTLIASALLVPIAIAIVTWALGWGVLLVLGIAFVFVVLVLTVYAWLSDRRAAQQDETRW